MDGERGKERREGWRVGMREGENLPEPNSDLAMLVKDCLNFLKPPKANLMS